MEIYEVKGVSESSQIKKAYEDAVKENKQYYRTVSKTNQIYGWDENLNKFVKAQIGQEYFENPHYVAPVEEVEEPIEEIVEPTVVENATVEEVIEPVSKEPDYKALFEEREDMLKKALCEKDALKEELDRLKAQFAEYKGVVERFKAL